MAKLCEAAELKAVEVGRYLTPYTREKLSAYSDEEQVAWIANPLVEWMLQRIMNDMMCGTSCPVQVTNSAPKMDEKLDNKPKTEPKKEDPPKDDDDDADLGFSLFD